MRIFWGLECILFHRAGERALGHGLRLNSLPSWEAPSQTDPLTVVVLSD